MKTSWSKTLLHRKAKRAQNASWDKSFTHQISDRAVSCNHARVQNDPAKQREMQDPQTKSQTLNFIRKTSVLLTRCHHLPPKKSKSHAKTQMNSKCLHLLCAEVLGHNIPSIISVLHKICLLITVPHQELRLHHQKVDNGKDACAQRCRNRKPSLSAKEH